MMDLKEALTPAQRAKRKRTMRRIKGKIAMGRKRAKMRTAGKEVLMRRALRAAKQVVRKKILAGKDYNDLPYASRQMVDDKVNKKKSLIARLAKKFFPKMREKELARKRNKK